MRIPVLTLAILATTLFLTAAVSAQVEAAAGATAVKTPPKMIRGGVLNGKAIDLPKPVYAEDIKAAKVGGTVPVEVMIDEAGNVIDAKADVFHAMSKEHMTVEQEQRAEMLDSLGIAAENAARRARFSPTLLSGIPVKVTGTIIYTFVADGDKGPHPIEGGVLNGKTVSLPKPLYPPAAAAVRASGVVLIQVVVDENGNVESATAISGHPLLRPAAEVAARQAKFSPTLLSGKPVRVTGVITYNFQPPKTEPQ